MNRKTFLKTGLFSWMAALFIPGIVVNSAKAETNLNINYKNLNKMEFILEDNASIWQENITITKQNLKLKKRLNLPNRKDLVIKIDSQGNKMGLFNRVLAQDILKS